MNKFKFLFFLVGFLVIASCSKDEFKTEGELMGEKVQQLANREDISSVVAYLADLNGGYTTYRKSDEARFFKIEGQVILVGRSYYNLGKLVKYKIVYDNTKSKILELYFEGYQ
ncbi:hypothetical protein INQ51_13890 [Maribellus sp. CM-23]|uniref:hypothetical protein n=1 Tax=Maribellus sp. CM-23 TaxID=2781026 RepID=UPI001F1A3EA9|nr:hypothetical protein [Maribellus sp. CM-23]MCE4565405.1 hypothetical protein [Maribellus sp. CM-23]